MKRLYRHRQNQKANKPTQILSVIIMQEASVKAVSLSSSSCVTSSEPGALTPPGRARRARPRQDGRNIIHRDLRGVNRRWTDIRKLVTVLCIGRHGSLSISDKDIIWGTSATDGKYLKYGWSNGGFSSHHG